MRKFLLLLPILFVCIFSHKTFSQTTKSKFEKCKVVSLGTTYTSEQITKAVDAADWCGYFHKTKNYVLKFDDGAIIELYSYTELAPKGVNITIACVQDEVISDNSTYSILSSGTIAKQVPKNSHVKSYNKK